MSGPADALHYADFDDRYAAGLRARRHAAEDEMLLRLLVTAIGPAKRYERHFGILHRSKMSSGKALARC